MNRERCKGKAILLAGGVWKTACATFSDVYLLKFMTTRIPLYRYTSDDELMENPSGNL